MTYAEPPPHTHTHQCIFFFHNVICQVLSTNVYDKYYNSQVSIFTVWFSSMNHVNSGRSWLSTTSYPRARSPLCLHYVLPKRTSPPLLILCSRNFSCLFILQKYQNFIDIYILTEVTRDFFFFFICSLTFKMFNAWLKIIQDPMPFCSFYFQIEELHTSLRASEDLWQLFHQRSLKAWIEKPNCIFLLVLL